jgi:hypothetical protein
MRFRSWIMAMLAAIASFFGFGPGNSKGLLGDAHSLNDSAFRHRAARAAREFRDFNRSRYAVVPPFHKVKGKTRAVLRPSLPLMRRPA